MTVYELIQELAQYDPITPVYFHVAVGFDADVEVNVERDDLPFGNETVSGSAYVEFDEDVSLDEIKSDKYGATATFYLSY